MDWTPFQSIAIWTKSSPDWTRLGPYRFVLSEHLESSIQYHRRPRLFTVDALSLHWHPRCREPAAFPPPLLSLPTLASFPLPPLPHRLGLDQGKTNLGLDQACPGLRPISSPLGNRWSNRRVGSFRVLSYEMKRSTTITVLSPREYKRIIKNEKNGWTCDVSNHINMRCFLYQTHHEALFGWPKILAYPLWMGKEFSSKTHP